MKDNFYKRLLDNANDLIWAVNMEGCFIYINDNISEWGYDKDELIGKPLLDILNTKIIGKRYSETSKLGVRSAFEMEVLDKRGQAHMVRVSSSPLQDDDEEIIGVMGIIHDISETQKLEEKLKNEERLASLGRLATGVAHEIRNPLSSVKMNLAILRKRLQPQGVDEEHFTIAQEEVANLENIVTELIDYAKPMPLDLKRLNLNEAIESAVMMTKSACDEKNVSVKIIKAGDAPLALLDKVKIRQVLLNVILNAIQASSPKGSVTVQAQYIKDKQKAKIVVSDNGEGIKPEEMKFVFDPFFTTKKSGVGMGLSIVKSIINNHNGTITIKSEQGKGTDVSLEFPVC